MSKMTLQQIADNIDKSDNNNANVDYFDFEDIFKLENLSYDVELIASFKNRVQGYWIMSNYCTDTVVGIIAYFFDNEFIGISCQSGRKYDKEFSFSSKEKLKLFYEYIQSFEQKDDILEQFDIFDMSETVDENYHHNYNEDLILQHHKDRAYYKGVKIKSMSQVPVKEGEIASINKKMNIKLVDGTEKQVDINEIDFKIHIKE